MRSVRVKRSSGKYRYRSANNPKFTAWSTANVSKRRQLFLQQLLEEELLFEPHRHGSPERPDPTRCERQIGFDESLELHEGLVVKRDVAQVAQRHPALAEAVQ